MALFNGLQKYLIAFFLVIFSASSSLAAANDFSLESDTPSQTVHQTNKSATASAGAGSICLSTYVTNFGNGVADLARGGSAGSVIECVEDPAAVPLHIPLHTDDGKVIWSLAPSFNRFSFNPIDDIRNLQVMLKFRF